MVTGAGQWPCVIQEMEKGSDVKRNLYKMGEAIFLSGS